MDEVKGLARLVRWNMRGARCDIFRCQKPAEYMIRHREGMFSGTDSHFMLCKDCAESILRNLPEELKDLIAVPPQEITVPQVLSVVQFVQSLDALKRSPLMEALVNGRDVPEEVRQALGSLLDLLAESGSEVTVDEPELEDKPFECEVCHARFKSEMALRGHMAVHSKKGGGK